MEVNKEMKSDRMKVSGLWFRARLQKGTNGRLEAS